MPLQQQQILFNGKEVRNSDKLSALGVKDDDLLMMASGAADSRYTFSLMLHCMHPYEIMHFLPVNCAFLFMLPSKNMRW